MLGRFILVSGLCALIIALSEPAHASVPPCESLKEPQIGKELIANSSGSSSSASQSQLDAILVKASQYVQQYDRQLGSLIGEEVYEQQMAWKKTPPASVMVQTGLVQKRLTQSDFAIMQVGKEWVGLREVNCVDGVPSERKTPDFQKVFDDAFQSSKANDPVSDAILKTLDEISRESAAYNIGDLYRTANLPTLALKILRPGIEERFKFKKSKETAINGVKAWAVEFQEVRGPALIQDANGSNEFTNGVLWIDSKTGRVLRTEIRLNEKQFSLQTVVSYADNSHLGILTPASMEEHYLVAAHLSAAGLLPASSIDCRADYSNFRRFQTEVHLDFGPASIPTPNRPPPIDWSRE